MDKSLNNKLSGGKPLSNSEFTFTSQQNTTSDLSGLLALLQPTSTDVISSGADGDKSFGTVTAVTINTGDIHISNDLYLGDDDLLRITQAADTTINTAIVRGVIITTKNIEDTTDYTSIKLIVPYLSSIPDFVPDPAKNEAPDNYFEITNTKFKVSGPMTIIKSIRAVFTEPIITVSYIDKVDASISESDVLKYNEYDRGISFEYIENKLGGLPIKLGFFGFSVKKDRFVFYKNAAYTGTTQYLYTDKNGQQLGDSGILTDYNVGSTDTSNPTKVDIDSLYTNTISSAYYTTTTGSTRNRKLNIYAYDDMAITVGVDSTESDPTPPPRNYNYSLSSTGKIDMTAGNLSNGLPTTSTFTCSSTGEMQFQSKSTNGIKIGTEYSEKPISMGNESVIIINNYAQISEYLSIGVTSRNQNAMVQIGGSFSGNNGISSGLLLNETITGVGSFGIYNINSTPSIITPANQLVPNVANVALFPPPLTIGSGGSVDRSSTLYIDGATTNASTNYAIYTAGGNVKFMGTNNSYMSWENNSFSIFQGGVLVNQTVITGTTTPVLAVTAGNNSTSMYTMFKQAVSTTSETELFVDGATTRISISNNKVYNIFGTFTATQSNGTSASFRVEATVAYISGIKSIKQLTITVLHNDNDLFTFNVSTSLTGDNLYFAGQSTSTASTNWYGNVFVDVINTT